MATLPALPSHSPVTRFLVSAAAFVVLVAGMKQATEIFVPFLISIFVAVICIPPITFMRARRIPHALAVTLMVLMIVVIGLLLGTVVSQAVSQFANDVPEYQSRLAQIYNQLLAWLVKIGIELDVEQLRTMIKPQQVFPFAGNLLAAIGNMMTNALVILLTVIFLLAEEVSVEQKLRYAMPTDSRAADSVAGLTRAINQYMAIKAAISTLTGFMVWVLLAIIGVDYAILWAVLALLFNFIPTLGSLIAAVPAVLLALVQLDPLSALYTAVGYFVINTLVGNVIEPKVMGRGLGLSAFVVLISLIFWGWVLGPVGMLLSVPLTVMVKIGLEIFPDTRWLAVLMGSGEQIEQIDLSDVKALDANTE